jgi:hypothetical protein
MITILEEALKQKTSGTPSEVLYSQWVFDKQIIPGALSEISNIFPHYSLHDQSHSIAIINNIIRVIGEENIVRLSAIDIWLILQAAYYHDTGMVLSGSDVLETINQEKFIMFFETIIEDSSNSLHDYATKFEIKENKIHLRNTIQDVSAQEGFKYILAEYFRRVHSQRSERVVNDPGGELALPSPRSIIPKRIWTILGKICSLHTANFNEVMELPFNMVGIDTEDAHPRLIAGLLRIGDLLDLDNNRFSEVMLKTLVQIPHETLSHKEKHLSVEVFSVSNEFINITAKCINYDSATLAHHWFSYLRSEISNQTLFWNKIAPNKYSIALPSIESLNVVLNNYKYVENGQKPCFSISSKKALNIIQGSNIYSSEFQALREILQNATDATLLRLWLDIKEEGLVEKMKTPSDEFYELAKKLPIKVNITKSKVAVDEKYTWTISITDQGIGLSFKDIKHLLQSNSNDNIEKNELVRSMPKWMQPSGVFGIGFQSAFLLCDKVKLETKSYQTQEFHELTLHSPTGKFKGDVYISEYSTSFSKKPGTVFELEYKTPKIPDSFSIPSNYGRAEHAAYSFDPFVSDSLDVDIMKIIDEIERFSYYAIIPIEVFVDGQPEKFYQNENFMFDNFDKDTGIAFSILNFDINAERLDCFYKNQPVERSRFEGFPFVDAEINFMHGPASRVLHLNRNDFLSDFRREMKTKIAEIIFFNISNSIDDFGLDEDGKQIASFAIEYQNVEKDFQIESHNYWKEIFLCEGFKLGDISSLSQIKIVIIKNRQMNLENKFEFEDSILTAYFSEHSSLNAVQKFFLEKLFKNIAFELSDFKEDKMSFPSPKGSTLLPIISFTLTKRGKNLMHLPDEIIKYMYSKLKLGITFYSRHIIPCPSDFSALRIKDNARPPYVGEAQLSHPFTPGYAKMIAPFQIITHRRRTIPPQSSISIPDSLIQWVYDNRFHENVTLEEIRQAYNAFMDKYTQFK